MIEDAFQRMKDPHFLSWSPVFHWTDQKIRVHAFYCVLALTLTALLRRELHQKGIDLSIPALGDTLSGIQEVAVIYPSEGAKRGKSQVVLTRRTPLQQQIMDALCVRATLCQLGRGWSTPVSRSMSRLQGSTDS